ncbi:hypothetical protein [Streptosporangium sp. NPDC087985]|uniref:hypothetical protein n=1 Tax=Streptosporangium sp. NPDC087985 TaxID=3366196 RepID=UPI0037F239A3
MNDRIRYVGVDTCRDSDGEAVPCGGWKLVMRSGVVRLLPDAHFHPVAGTGKVGKEALTAFAIGDDGRTVAALNGTSSSTWRLRRYDLATDAAGTTITIDMPERESVAGLRCAPVGRFPSESKVAAPTGPPGRHHNRLTSSRPLRD